MSFAAFEDQFIIPFEGVLIQEQLEAAERLIKDEENDYFVTGGAGTGKSYLIKGLRSIIPISVCSTTAMSAINVGGITIDRMFNFSRDTWKTRNKSKLDEIMRETAPNILIDESSMIGENMADCVYNAARRYQKRLILVGDMAQASPVKDKWATKTRLFREAKRINLQHCHRQSDQTYLNALNHIRAGIVNDDVRREFAQCIDKTNSCSDDYVRLFATNSLADDYNAVRFNKLPQTTPAVKLIGEYTDMRQNTQWEVSANDIKRAFEGARIANDEWMQIGARVLIGMNHINGWYVNGDAGIVTEITKGDGSKLSQSDAAQVPSRHIVSITVLLDRTGGEVTVERCDRMVTDHRGRATAQVTGFPVKLGWAHTIHKAQGMTLQHAYVSLSSIAQGFRDEGRHGIAYVGLSRTTTIAGLRIDSWVDEAVYCSAEVRDFI